MFRAILKGDISKDPKQAACILPISLGQKYHEGEKFILTIELVNIRFGECTIVIADTLGRHAALKESEEDTDEMVQQKLRDKGDKWIEQNAGALKKLTITHKIVRWDKYLQHSEYQTKRNMIESLYKEDEPFKKAVEGSIANFLRRYKQQRQDKEGYDLDKAFRDSLEYVKEECAVLLLWPEVEKCDFLVYPNKLHEAMYNLRRRFIAPDNGDSTVLQPLVVEFKKIKQSLGLQLSSGDGQLNGQPNGHAYVAQYMSGAFQTPNPAMFFQAQPPVNMTMSKSKLHEFIERHLQLSMEFAKSMDDPKARFEFLKLSFAHMGTIIYPITVTDDSDSNSGDHNHNNGSSPQSSLQMNSK